MVNLDELRPNHADHPVFRDLYLVRNAAGAADAEYRKHLLDTHAARVGPTRTTGPTGFGLPLARR